MVYEQWLKLNLHCELHSLKAKDQTVKITLYRFHVRLICPGNMKQLSCIVVSEYWHRQDLDRWMGWMG